MRKLLAVTVALFLVALAAPAGAAHPQAAGACGFYYENDSVRWVLVFDYSAGAYTFIRYDLYTFTDGCGSKVYESVVTVLNGTPMWLDASLRVWVCGNYAGQASSGAVWAAQVATWSSWSFYGPCGRQADNLSSWSSSTVTSPATTNGYLTAG